MSSCVRLVLLAKGGHMPRLEANHTIYQSGKTIKIDSTELLVVKEEIFNARHYGLINKLALFDSAGYSIDVFTNSENPQCKSNSLSAIMGFGKVSYFPRDSNLTFSKEASRWEYLHSKTPYKLASKKNCDYTVVYYWNSFTGKYLNHEHILEIQASIDKNPDIRFDLILVNEDYREGMILEK